MLSNEQEQALIELLAQVYRKTPWGKMRTRHNPHDIFNHRVRAAARRGTLFQFCSKLCNSFGLQSLPQECVGPLEILRPHEIQVLNALSTEHIPYCILAIARAKELKEQTKLPLEVQND